MISECIILAGGLGTRLRGELPDTPKVLAPVAGRPFLSYVFSWLERNGITHAILSVGYRSGEVISWGNSYTGNIKLRYSVEPEPLGTGGAIAQAMNEAQTAQVFVTNGDTLFDADLVLMEQYHRQHKADLTLALKPMERFNRYGLVKLDDDLRITGFEEKGFHEKGLINGGVYILNKECLHRLQLPEKFSFETDFLEARFNHIGMYGFVQDAYFIDIGIPDDYKRAQEELKRF